MADSQFDQQVLLENHDSGINSLGAGPTAGPPGPCQKRSEPYAAHGSASAQPWKLEPEQIFSELRSFADASTFDALVRDSHRPDAKGNSEETCTGRDRMGMEGPAVPCLARLIAQCPLFLPRNFMVREQRPLPNVGSARGNSPGHSGCHDLATAAPKFAPTELPLRAVSARASRGFVPSSRRKRRGPAAQVTLVKVTEI